MNYSNCTFKHIKILHQTFVIVWLAVVFGINSVSNAGKKIVIVRGTNHAVTD